MNQPNPQEQDQPELQIPKELAEELAQLVPSRIAIPPEVDRAILGRARRQLGRLRRRRWVLRPVFGLATAAAAALLLIVLIPLLNQQRSAMVQEQEAAYMRPVLQEDIDRNGHVDILDAFMMARTIESEALPGQGWDLNGDGKVDQQDIDRVALAAVKVTGGTVR